MRRTHTPPLTPRARAPTPASQVVKTAEQQLLARELSGADNKEYLAMDGLPAFNKLTASVLFGADAPHIKEGRVVTIQGLSVRRQRARAAAGACAARGSGAAAWHVGPGR